MNQTPNSLFAEDLEVGEGYGLGIYQVTEEEILEFASRWDPQSFHVDKAIAEKSLFGGLIASGVHTAAMLQRLMVDSVFSKWAILAGRSIDDVHLKAPVRPGMELTGELTIESVDIKGDHPGLATLRCVLRNEETAVLTCRVTTYVHRRPESSG